MKQVLVVDDEQQILSAIDATLSRKGYAVTTAGNGQEALGKLNQGFFQAVITDVRMPRMDGMGVLREIKRKAPETPVILLTGHGTVDNAVEALKQGAFDYLMKPFTSKQLEDVLNKATRSMPDEDDEQGEADQPGRILARDPKMKQLLNMAAQAAESDATVLVEAESGTGKELLARYIHRRSRRHRGPFVAVNCAALPDELLESELFGHEKGAFTGALKRKPGKFELADGGTILLDEVGEMPALLQAKLLRVLQEGEIDTVGGLQPVAVDVRVVATTNCNLKEAVGEGRFREDLYYRLNVIPLTIPPLGRRKDDIPLLVSHFCRKHEQGEERKHFSEETLDLLQKYDWPGNVRELENVVRRALAMCRNPVVSPGDLFLQLDEEKAGGVQLKAGLSLREMEKEMIRVTLEETGGNRTHAAEMLGISLRTLRNKLKEYREEGDYY
ncbi:MAG TPA: sigma-54 dependent transcriptional regulator [Acidobacteriota bacterium]|nr:sigma-54 dependent transcriptional regulator [Acidobacteriota bacterium]